MKKPKLINKQYKKHQIGLCYFCKENNYFLLDLHRIVPGDSGPGYIENNTLVVCSNCHRRIHSGEILIDRKYLSSSGKYILHYWINKEEKWE